MKNQTYTKMRGGLKGFASDTARLYRVRTRNIDGDVRTTINQVASVAQSFQATTSTDLVDRHILVLGAGQHHAKSPRLTFTTGSPP